MERNIEDLIEKHKSTVYGIAFTWLKNHADAEDVFQETFLACHRKNPHFNGEEHQKAWLIKTTVNCCKSQLRKNRQAAKLTAALSETAAVFCQNETESAVYSAVCALPPKYRAAIYLFYFEKYATKEISKLLHTRPSTVRMQLTRGRQLLKETLKKEGEGIYEQHF